LREFLDEFGHREAGGTMLLSQETWRDVPHVVLGAVKGLATTTSHPARGVQAFHEARDEALNGFLLRLPGMKRLFLAVLTQARSFTAVREDTRFYATLVMPVLRHAALEMGGRLQDVGSLQEVHDVFHLKFGELAEAGTPWPPPPEARHRVRELVRRRKEKRESLASVPVVDPRLYRRAAPAGNVLLQGSPGSPGTARGPVCVVRDGSQFGKVRPGDVLVAPYTNPAWTPLFQQAAAVIVDTGSAASHAAITAREYGIPAVMATTDGTDKLQDGQLVEVDGNQGIVVDVSHAGTTTST
jgi:pyruvate,water dikinase